MSPNVTSDDVGEESPVMASVDDDGRDRRFVIADVRADDAWISAPLGRTTALAEWR